MHIGITGTQTGASEEQVVSLMHILSELPVDTIHHGDCLGADHQAHTVARKLGIKVVLHPPDDSSKRAWCEADDIKEELPYLKRNLKIVEACDLLIALPKGDFEERRSGTWFTVRRARIARKPIIIIWPNGVQEKD